MILGFFELPDDEQPPPGMWHDDEALAEWFEEVERKRKERTGGPGSERVETVPMDDNDLTRMYH